MAYIGVQPTDTYLSIASQQITGNGGATYTLDYSVSDEESLAVFVNNVRQNVSSYTVSGTSLTLGGTISASDSCWVLFLGRTVGTKVPAVGSVTNDMLAGSIANAKLANSSVTVNGTSIALGASGTISAGITEADQWRVTADFSGTAQDVTANLSRSGPYIGTGMTQSSGIFTFPSTGIYHVFFQRALDSRNVDSNPNQVFIYQSTDSGSNWVLKSRARQSTKHGNDISWATVSCDAFLDVTNASTTRVKFSVDSDNSIVTTGHGQRNETYMTFIRLGDT